MIGKVLLNDTSIPLIPWGEFEFNYSKIKIILSLENIKECQGSFGPREFFKLINKHSAPYSLNYRVTYLAGFHTIK